MGKVTVPAFPTPVRASSPHPKDGGIRDFVLEFANDTRQQRSLLEAALQTSWSDRLSVLIPSIANRDLIYPVEVDGEIDVKLVSTADMEPGEIEIPMIQIEYAMDNDGLGIDPRSEESEAATSVLRGFLAAIRAFENELAFDILGKAVRSQRNKIRKEISREAVSEAMQLSESLGFAPTKAILNSASHSKLRTQIEDSGGKLLGMYVYDFPPKRRGNRTRNYFLGYAGVASRSPMSLSFDEQGNVFLSYSLGAVVFERNAIACLEEPE